MQCNVISGVWFDHLSRLRARQYIVTLVPKRIPCSFPDYPESHKFHDIITNRAELIVSCWDDQLSIAGLLSAMMIQFLQLPAAHAVLVQKHSDRTFCHYICESVT
jgi:hypothetical protein